MFENAVVGLKEGLSPDPLLELAKKAVRPGAKLHLVTLVRAGTYEDEPERIEAEERHLESHAEAIRSEGFDVSVQVELIAMAAGGEMVEIANERGSDLIVIGLAKRTRVGKILMGSDAQRVLLVADVPVLGMKLDR